MRLSTRGVGIQYCSEQRSSRGILNELLCIFTRLTIYTSCVLAERLLFRTLEVTSSRGSGSFSLKASLWVLSSLPGNGGDVAGQHAAADRPGHGQPHRGEHRDERHQQPEPQRLHRQGLPRYPQKSNRA